jgi:hypothetical protein
MESSLSRFLKIVSSKLDRIIKSLEQLEDLLVELEIKDLTRIEESLIQRYFYK